MCGFSFQVHSIVGSKVSAKVSSSLQTVPAPLGGLDIEYCGRWRRDLTHIFFMLAIVVRKLLETSGELLPRREVKSRIEVLQLRSGSSPKALRSCGGGSEL